MRSLLIVNNDTIAIYWSLVISNLFTASVYIYNNILYFLFCQIYTLISLSTNWKLIGRGIVLWIYHGFTYFKYSNICVWWKGTYYDLRALTQNPSESLFGRVNTMLTNLFSFFYRYIGWHLQGHLKELNDSNLRNMQKTSFSSATKM